MSFVHITYTITGRPSKETLEEEAEGPLTEKNLKELNVKDLKAACKAKNLATSKSLYNLSLINKMVQKRR